MVNVNKRRTGTPKQKERGKEPENRPEDLSRLPPENKPKTKYVNGCVTPWDTDQQEQMGRAQINARSVTASPPGPNGPQRWVCGKPTGGKVREALGDGARWGACNTVKTQKANLIDSKGSRLTGSGNAVYGSGKPT